MGKTRQGAGRGGQGEERRAEQIFSGEENYLIFISRVIPCL